VTPSGVIPACGELRQQQLVDGGYAEASGLGTVADMAPSLMELVRSHNAEVLSRDRKGEPVLVPTVVFLQNHFRTDLIQPPSRVASELLVPPTARRAEKTLGQSAAMRQRLERSLADPVPCLDTAPDGAGGSPARCRAVGPGLPGFVSVAPVTEPSVTAPLGWTLSEASRSKLLAAMVQARDCATATVPGQSPRLCDLLARLRPPAPLDPPLSEGTARSG
jgi:hypothetical protein